MKKFKKRIFFLLSIFLFSLVLFLYINNNILLAKENPRMPKIGMAVEFNDHAACAYVAKYKGWFKKAGLNIKSFESYITGVALASALVRGDIQVAYICLAPAINAYGNGKVKIKIVSGTHLYGYGLVVNQAKINSLKDLEDPHIKVACVREGSQCDLFMNLLFKKESISKKLILKKIMRMNPPHQIILIKAKRIDAAFLPEHYASLAERLNFKMIYTAKDLWQGFPGSVIVVKNELIKNHPEIVKTIVNISKKATRWINNHPEEAVQIIKKELTISGEKIFPSKLSKITLSLVIKKEDIDRSMKRLVYTNYVDPAMVQKVINKMAEIGYLKSGFDAKDILDLSF
ncbi:MAG: nitrate ABC transporter substrate-binding protein [Spirochaetes bacterium]|nr:MAG: nitrate ABC transporter substrate-binding protein [Spirochaetota bacterium]RLA89935.1 MAG: nitrate ABC transporter substrate-binding protein [Deltaproteobacteria bacterium]